MLWRERKRIHRGKLRDPAGTWIRDLLITSRTDTLTTELYLPPSFSYSFSPVKICMVSECSFETSSFTYLVGICVPTLGGIRGINARCLSSIVILASQECRLSSIFTSCTIWRFTVLTVRFPVASHAFFSSVCFYLIYHQLLITSSYHQCMVDDQYGYKNNHV